MGKHETGYKRIERDWYPSPSWMAGLLIKLVDICGKDVWECACGDGRLSQALAAAGANVLSTDISDYGYAAFDGIFDFGSDHLAPRAFAGLITNPPFGPRGRLAEHFVEAGIERMGDGFLAPLLPADFDSAKRRMHLFGNWPQFAGKLLLTRRIKWFDHPSNPRMQPKENSAWFLWVNVELPLPQIQTPVLRYTPQPGAV